MGRVIERPARTGQSGCVLASVIVLKIPFDDLFDAFAYNKPHQLSSDTKCAFSVQHSVPPS